ncbi:MAG: hypothetical protein M3R06_05495 [Chloroflexota bacterium]|nr:hypothetical protein [Chloroflexota bacterium]
MSDAITSADHHLREALALLRREESERLEDFNREMAHIRQRISAIQTALSPTTNNDVAERQVVPPSKALERFPEQRFARRTTFVVPSDLVPQLKGSTQPEALIKIAQYYDGTLRTAEAKQILIKARLITGNPKNALSHLYALLRDTDRFKHLDGDFEKIDPGVFRLVPKGTDRQFENQGALDIDVA